MWVARDRREDRMAGADTWAVASGQVGQSLSRPMRCFSFGS